MQYTRLVIEEGATTFSLSFHPRLTVVAGVDAARPQGPRRRADRRPRQHPDRRQPRAGRRPRPPPRRAPPRHRRPPGDRADQRLRRQRGVPRPPTAASTCSAATASTPAGPTTSCTSTATSLGTRRPARRRRQAPAASSTRPSCGPPRPVSASPRTSSRPSATAPGRQRAEDAELVARIEHHHHTLEAALEPAPPAPPRRLDGLRRLAASPPCPSPSSDPRMAVPILAIGLVTVLLAFMFRARVEAAQRQEQSALTDAGADSYLGYVVGRVNDMMDDTEQPPPPPGRRPRTTGPPPCAGPGWPATSAWSGRWPTTRRSRPPPACAASCRPSDRSPRPPPRSTRRPRRWPSRSSPTSAACARSAPAARASRSSSMTRSPRSLRRPSSR